MNLNDKRFPEVVTIHEFHKINQFHQKRVIFLHFFFGISGEPVERADIVRFERHITGNHRNIDHEIALLRQDIAVVGHVEIVPVLRIEPHHRTPLRQFHVQPPIHRSVDAGRADEPAPPDETLQFEGVDRRQFGSDQLHLFGCEPRPDHRRRNEIPLGAVQHRHPYFPAQLFLFPLRRISQRKRQVDRK